MISYSRQGEARLGGARHGMAREFSCSLKNRTFFTNQNIYKY